MDFLASDKREREGGWHFKSVIIFFFRKHVLESTSSKPTNAKIHLNYIRCNGDESNLAECGSSFGPSFCYRVVKITCNAGESNLTYIYFFLVSSYY